MPVGRLHAEEMFEIARIAKQYGNGQIRTCNSQNFIIPNVPPENITGLLNEPLFEAISANPKSFIGHAVSCTGIEYCNLALVETKRKITKNCRILRYTNCTRCSGSYSYGRVPEFMWSTSNCRHWITRCENENEGKRDC